MTEERFPEDPGDRLPPHGDPLLWDAEGLELPEYVRLSMKVGTGPWEQVSDLRRGRDY